MSGFDFFRVRASGYVPYTPNAALRAVGTGMAPAERFVHTSCSAKPLSEEPFDLDGIERTLSRRDMNIDTACLLKRIFEKMVASMEPETALFGAEGINTLESRFIERIDGLKAESGRGKEARTWFLLAQAFTDFARLHEKARSIRAFYLREAFAALREYRAAGGEETREATSFAVEILVDLGLFDQAARMLDRGPVHDDPAILLLKARVAFHRKEYTRVADCCRRVGKWAHELPFQDRRVVEFWIWG